MMSLTPIRCGLIGFGLSGRVFHAPFVSQLESFRLQAVATRNGNSVLEHYPDARIESTSEALYAAEDIDLVIITAPNHLHYGLAKAALDADKHVVLEKPAVTALADMESLSRLARTKGKVLSVYQNRRYDGDFLHLRTLMASGSLGQLKHLDSRFDRFRPTPQQRWRELPGEGTGIFWDLGPHLLDQALALFGPPKALQANLHNLRDGSQTTDWFELELDYANTRVVLGSTPFEPGPMRRFNARFTAGSWQCWGLDPQEAALRAEQMPWHEGYPDVGDSQQATRYELSSKGTVNGVEDAPDPGHYRHYYQKLATAITTGSEPPVTLEDACALIYGLELAERSSQLGKKLSWDYTPA